MSPLEHVRVCAHDLDRVYTVANHRVSKQTQPHPEATDGLDTRLPHGYVRDRSNKYCMQQTAIAPIPASPGEVPCMATTWRHRTMPAIVNILAILGATHDPAISLIKGDCDLFCTYADL